MPIYKYYTAQGCLAQGIAVHPFVKCLWYWWVPLAYPLQDLQIKHVCFDMHFISQNFRPLYNLPLLIMWIWRKDFYKSQRSIIDFVSSWNFFDRYALRATHLKVLFSLFFFENHSQNMTSFHCRCDIGTLITWMTNN